MATARILRAISAARSSSSSSSSACQIGKSTRGNPTIMAGQFVSGPRCASSFSDSSSSSSSDSSEPRKKLTDRLSTVIDAVNDRKLPPELRGQRNNVRSETDIINVVEQRIWHSMEEGQFENLPGKGKPLNLETNPHADPAEDTLYRILSKNGCAPEWVELNKEIRSQISEWRSGLKKAWASKCSGVEVSAALKAQLRGINDKVSFCLIHILAARDRVLFIEFGLWFWLQVFRYNLIVPFGRQMFGLKWEKELDRLNEQH
ncbi:unnamed protein product [Linum tenue]|uniref:DnaJ homologue subfamily C member 28 conserved domain-containing protein n=1 Tax=Linum tenue TaxID=586396 RepID=A0AAV0JCA1_9ROSI|nr:unnamed protein product [Linum tenue]